MKIPKKLKIGNLVYKIGALAQESEDDYYGRGFAFNQWIKLSPRISQECKEETLFHEIIHLILEQQGFREESKDEKLISVLSAGIYQVLKDNKLLK